MITDMELSILLETMKNAEQTLESIQTMLTKVYDVDLAYELNRQANNYRELERKARQKLRSEGIFPKERTRRDKARNWYFLQANTLLNVSTGHLAGLMIRENQKGIMGMREAACGFRNEFAEEFINFEEKNIEILRKYL